MRLAILAVLLAAAPAAAADPPKLDVELHSDRIGVSGMTLPESDKPVYAVAFSAKTDAKGVIKGSISLDLTPPPAYDEFGFVVKAAPYAGAALLCTATFVKATTRTYVSRRLGAPPSETREWKETWHLYAVTGKGITSKLFVAVRAGEESWQTVGRFLVHDKDGTVKHAIDLRSPPPQEPCHPGCFPAGTLVRTPGGPAAVDKLRAGDAVTTVAADGKLTTAKVTAVFVTRNRLLEVRTTDGKLETTETQPVSLEAGGFRPAGELKPGDRVWKWAGGARKAVAVTEVTALGRRAEVFNLVLGEPTAFVAGDFLVRSKPPAAAEGTGGPVRP